MRCFHLLERMQSTIREIIQKKIQLSLQVMELAVLQCTTRSIVGHIVKVQRQDYMSMRERTKRQVTNERVHAVIWGRKLALDHERLEKAFVGHIAVTGVRRDQIQVTKELSLGLLANGFGGLGKIVQVTFVHLCSCQPRNRSLRVSSWVAYLAGYYDKNVIGQILERNRHDECASVHRK